LFVFFFNLFHFSFPNLQLVKKKAYDFKKILVIFMFLTHLVNVFFFASGVRVRIERETGRKFLSYFRDTTSQSSNAKDTIKEFHLDKAQLAFTIVQKNSYR
jgi:hypothetical protein